MSIERNSFQIKSRHILLKFMVAGIIFICFFEKNTQKTTKITTKKTPKIKIKTEPLDLYLQKVNLNIDFRYLCSSCFT